MPKGNIAKSYAISDAKIGFVSLVDKAANKHKFLITKSEGDTATIQIYGRIVKADEDKHYVTGIVYEPMTEDTDGNYMTEEEITKAAHWFMKNSGKPDIPCGLLLLYGVVKTGPCREAITITEPITHMDMKKAFRLITRVGKLPDAQPDPDRIHGTITGCLMELQT